MVNKDRRTVCAVLPLKMFGKAFEIDEPACPDAHLP